MALAGFCRGNCPGRILPRQWHRQDFAAAMAGRQGICRGNRRARGHSSHDALMDATGGVLSVGPPHRRGRAPAAPRPYRTPPAAGRPARIMEDLLSELWYRLQDESIVNASISPYLARINAYIESVRRVNHPQQSELLRALENV